MEMKIGCIVALIGIVLILVSGCITAVDLTPTPTVRLQRDSNLLAACQYEWWTNTTQTVPVMNGYDIKNSTKTTVNWVCYYRDKPAHIQKIGDFETVSQARNYIWYYYESGQFPWIVVQP